MVLGEEGGGVRERESEKDIERERECAHAFVGLKDYGRGQSKGKTSERQFVPQI